MALFDSVIERVFSKYFQKREEDLRKNIGSDFYDAILKRIGTGNPVYMGDNQESYIKDGYLFNPTVYSIVSFIAQKAATIPWGVYKIKDEKALSQFKSGSPELTVKKLLMQRKALEEVQDHELERIFKQPNPTQGWADYFEQVIGFKLVTGNGYIHCISPENGVNAGKIQELWNLASPLIEILAGDKMNPVKGYRMISEKNVTIPPEQIIHLKYWTPEFTGGQMLYGLSPIRAARRVVSKSNASYDASTAAFQNSGMIGFIAGDKGTNEQGLTAEQAIAIQDKINTFTNPKNRGKIPVTSANLKWQQMGMSPVDLNMIESDKMDLRTLCNIYHVPSELFNDAANKTYSNTKEAARAIYVNAVIPALSQFRDSFNAFIKGKYESDVYVDYDLSVVPELQDDIQTMVAQLQNAWWITPNERRDLMGWEEDKDPMMSTFWIPAGLIPINETGITPDQLTDAAKRLQINDYR